ncbi:MAG TPA: diaminopimelate epimerase [Micropepsaceae bacterium]|nr:diaminopimelate epimerase [Micropepsaceae bacterium]
MKSFLKMHGLGNDFVIFDARTFPIPMDAATAKAVADRKRGIGCDQIILIERANKGADAFMRIYNADGGEVESCGNAARCVGSLLMAEMEKPDVLIATTGGPVRCSDARSGRVTVDLGAPRLDWREIPLAQAVDTESFSLQVPGFHEPALEAVSAVSVGNPHCVLFVEDVENAPVTTLGPAIEHHPWFPSRTNVEFVEARGRGTLRMRVWERGAGVTLACGTGACAAAVAAHLRGMTGRKVTLVLDGGELEIEWREADDHVLMTGPATFSFAGEVDLKSLSATVNA